MLQTILDPIILSTIASFSTQSAALILSTCKDAREAFSNPCVFDKTVIRLYPQNNIEEKFASAVNFAKNNCSSACMTIQMCLPQEFEDIPDGYYRNGSLNIIFLPQFVQKMNASGEVGEFFYWLSKEFPKLVNGVLVNHLSLHFERSSRITRPIPDVEEVVKVEHLSICSKVLKIMRCLDCTEEITIHGDFSKTFFCTQAKKVTTLDSVIDPSFISNCSNMNELTYEGNWKTKPQRWRWESVGKPRKLDKMVINLSASRIAEFIEEMSSNGMEVDVLVVKQDDFFMKDFSQLARGKHFWGKIVFQNISRAEGEIVGSVFRGDNFAFESIAPDFQELTMDQLFLVRFAFEKSGKVYGQDGFELEAFAKNAHSSRSIQKLEKLVNEKFPNSFQEEKRKDQQMREMLRNVYLYRVGEARRLQLEYFKKYGSKDQELKPLLELDWLLSEFLRNAGNIESATNLQKKIDEIQGLLRNGSPNLNQ